MRRRRDDPGPDLVALLTLQADLHLRLGEATDAQRLVDRAAALAERVGVPDWDDMCVVRTKGELALRSNDPASAARLAEDALHTGSATPRGEARLWNLAAIAYASMGDLDAAARALDHCLAAEEAAGLATFLANTHGNYAETLLELGDPAGAARHQLAALDSARSTGQPLPVAFSLMVAARFALEEGAVVDAVGIQSAADAILAREGYSLYATDEQQRLMFLERGPPGTRCVGLREARDRGRIHARRSAGRPDRSDPAAPGRCSIDHRRMTMSDEDPEIPQPSYRDRIAILPGDPPIAYRPGVVLLDEAARDAVSADEATPIFVVTDPDDEVIGDLPSFGQWYRLEGVEHAPRYVAELTGMATTPSSTSCTSRTTSIVAAARRIRRSPQIRGARTRGPRIRGPPIRGAPTRGLRIRGARIHGLRTRSR